MASLIDTFQRAPGTSHAVASASAQAAHPGGLGARRQAARQEAQAAAEKQEATTAGDLIGASASQGFIGAIDRAWEEDRVQKWTPGWQMPDDIQDRLEREGIPTEQWPLLERASSDDHLEFLIGVARQNVQDADVQSQFGILANMGASLVDPVGAAIDFASGGLGYAAKASRLANMARSGVVAASAGTAATMATAEYNPEVDGQEIVTAAALNFALGGALGARQGAQYVKPDRILELANKPIAGSSQSLGAARIAGLAEDPLPGLERRTLTEFEEQHVARGVDEAGVKPAFAAARTSLSAQMGKLKSSTNRAVGRWLYRDGVGYTDRSLAVGESAGEFAKRNALTMEVRMHNAHRTGWAAFRKEQGISPWDFAAKDAFEARVANVIRGLSDTDPTVNRVAAEYREVLQDAFKLKQRNGLIDEDAALDNYLPQVHSAKAYSKYLGDGGLQEADLVALYKGAVLSQMRKAALNAADEVDEDLAEAYARAIVNRGKRSLVGGQGDAAIRGIDLGDLEQLQELLTDSGVAAEKVANLLSKYQRKVGEESAIGSSKRRIRLDYEHRAVFTNRFGKQVELGVTDLLENDASSLVSRHVREAAGWSALASRGNVRTPSELKRLRELVETEAKKAGDDVEKTLRLFDVGISNIFGRSTETNPTSWWSRASRALRDHQYLRVMNQVGFTLFTELGPAIAHGGFTNVVSSIGELGNMLRRGADGRLTNGEARWLEELFAPGTEFLLHQPFMRHADDARLPPIYGSSKAGIFMENMTQQAQRITSIASGMAPVNTALQRIGGRAVLMRLMDIAKKAELSDAIKLRMRANGLDEAAQGELLGYLRGFKSIKELSEADMPWELRERMSAYLYRVSRQAVLEGDASDSILLMHGPTGKLLTQFRSFMAYSYERHFLNSLYHYRDWNTYAMVMLSTTIASMQWYARTYINTVGDTEKRKKLMTRENMVKAGIAQSSWGGIVPALVDTTMNLAGGDAVFANTRSTGLSNNLLGGVPAIDFLDGVAQAATIPGQVISPDREVTARELELALKLIWFQNLTGWQNFQREFLKVGVAAGYIPDTSSVESEARKRQSAEDAHSWGSQFLFGVERD